MPCSPAARSGVTPRPGSERPERARRERTPSGSRPMPRRAKEEPMATTAPDTSSPEPAEAGWLDPFLAAWRPGTGEPKEGREPATGRPLLTLPQSTPDDVARAAF